MVTFAEMIKDARYKSGMTLKAASERLGVAITTLQAYESGRFANPDYEFILAVHRLYNVPIMKLMGWNNAEQDDAAYLARSVSGTADSEKIRKIIAFMKKKAGEKLEAL